MKVTLTRRDWLAGAALAGPPRPRPNFLFVLSDDHHYRCAGAAGNPKIHTPHLDRLSQRGVLFTDATVSTPQCGPSRGVLLSGQESFRNGVRSNGALSFRAGAGPTVIEQLRRSGYDTCLIGKWHLETSPEECGFAHAPLWFPGGSSRSADPMLRHGFKPPSVKTPGHITDLLTGAALEFLGSRREPFFAWVAYNAPHTPWLPPPEFRALYEGKTAAELAPSGQRGTRPFDWSTYYSVISHLDAAMGRLIARLDQNGLWQNTVVVFLGDNGYMCGAKGLDGKVVPWEDSIRVPCIVAGGPVERGGAGRRLPDAVSSIDLPATWLDLAGVKPHAPLMGRSLAGILTRDAGRVEESFAVWDDGRPEALAVKRAVEPYRLIRTHTHKLIVWESGKQALFDLRRDPGEEQDLSPGNPPELGKLRSGLRRRLQQTGDHALNWPGR
jgi:arylsulfatase/arylsulfatase A